MNCKQGDLAIVVKSFNGNEGKIVRCLRLASGREAKTSVYEFVWLVDQPMKWSVSGLQPYAADEFMRPIRDTDGQDETLTWKDVPHKEVA